MHFKDPDEDGRILKLWNGEDWINMDHYAISGRIV